MKTNVSLEHRERILRHLRGQEMERASGGEASVYMDIRGATGEVIAKVGPSHHPTFESASAHVLMIDAAAEMLAVLQKVAGSWEHEYEPTYALSEETMTAVRAVITKATGAADV